MSIDLPDFEDLKKLAEKDPQELDFLCHFYSQQLIDSAPEKYQNRLNGLLFQIEASRRTSKNPLHRCITLSKMMMKSYEELQLALTDVKDCLSGEPTHKATPKVEKNYNNIIAFSTDDYEDQA